MHWLLVLEIEDTVTTAWFLQPSQIPHSPSAITVQLYCGLLSIVSRPNKLYDAYSHPPVFKMTLTPHHCDFYFPSRSLASDWRIYCPSVPQRLKARIGMTVISCTGKSGIPAECDFGRQTASEMPPKIAMWEWTVEFGLHTITVNLTNDRSFCSKYSVGEDTISSIKGRTNTHWCILWSVFSNN